MYDDNKFKNSPGQENGSRPRGLFLFLIVLFSIVALVSIINLTGTTTKEINLDQFEAMVQSNPGELEDVVFKEGKGFEFQKKGDPKGIKYLVQVLDPTAESERVTDLIIKSGARPKRKNKFVSDILPHLLIVIGIFVLIYFLFFRKLGQRGEGFMSFGKSRAKLINPELCEITFDNVAGIDEAVEEVSEVVNFLRSPQEFNKLGGRLPRGILLVGPPGVGKTLLAQAIAGEAGVPFFSISGSDFVELFVGVGASRVRDLFQKAKEKAPAIVFLDELDAIGRRRGTGLGGGHDEREQTLNSILVEMDGFERQTNVIVMAATNREDVLDPALLRPGRFDRQIYVDLPDILGREEILRVHARKIIMNDDVDLKILARATPMASGADLENILNEAALIAVMDGKEDVDWESIEKAREKIFWGRERKSKVMPEEDRKTTALHESGHAVCAHILPEVDPLHKVSIIPRGRALGMTMMLPEKDQYSIGKKKFLGNVVVMLAGRAAEKLYADDITSGAGDDLEKATNLVRKMVCEWGMSDAIGLVNYDGNNDRVFLGSELTRERRHSEDTQQKIDREINDILNDSFTKAEDILTENKEVLFGMVKALLELETLDSEQVDSIFKGDDVLSDIQEKIFQEEPSAEDLEKELEDLGFSEPESTGPGSFQPAPDGSK